MKKQEHLSLIFFLLIISYGISIKAQADPDTAQRASVDRFSPEAGILFVRDGSNFPGPNEPIDFDQGPFITKGLGRNGEFVSYYNFDVQPLEAASIYVLFREGESSPVEGQLNIIDVIPGDEGYNDFWHVHKIIVPSDYTANTITSLTEITSAGYPMEAMDVLVNCPVVPEGSTAQLRLNGEDPGLTQGWYKNQLIFYFNFSEKALKIVSNHMVPVSPIYVTFNINPGQPGGGPESGFRADTITGHTHNVISTLPEDETYSPLWSVIIYDNAFYDEVHDLSSASMANIITAGPNVNCPVVQIDEATSVVNDGDLMPVEYSLSQNYPNPFNPSTSIKFSIPVNENVTLKIYNSIGQEITELVNEVLPAGNYSIEWNAELLSSGVYYYTITTPQYQSARKMILLK
ncbi:MAG: T9SS type A sorting domain-containing protein [Ignavibacteriaceae bacterium]